MLISLVTWLSRLQWSRIHCPKSPIENHSLGVRVELYTRSFCQFNLNPEREQRLKLIYDLSNQGCSNKKISDFFNEVGLTSPRGTSYSQKLIWVTLKKYKERLNRKKFSTYSIIHPPEFYEVERIRKNGKK